MRLNRVLTDMLVQIDPKYARFVEDRGTSVVLLGKSLYGCAEAVALWHANLTATMEGDGFIPNPYDSCIFNKHEPSGEQVTVVIHVDDLFYYEQERRQPHKVRSVHARQVQGDQDQQMECGRLYRDDF